MQQNRHLIKMLIAFVGMGLLGLISLLLVNQYDKNQKGTKQNISEKGTTNVINVGGSINSKR